VGFHVLKCHNHNTLHLEDLRGTNIIDGDLGGGAILGHISTKKWREECWSSHGDLSNHHYQKWIIPFIYLFIFLPMK
jgi:hypothetical protein